MPSREWTEIWVRNPYVVEVHPIEWPPCDNAFNVSRTGGAVTGAMAGRYHLRPRAGREHLPHMTFDPGATASNAPSQRGPAGRVALTSKGFAHSALRGDHIVENPSQRTALAR